MSSSKRCQNCQIHSGANYDVDGCMPTTTCEASCPPLSCAPSPATREPSCEREVRPKRVLMNKIYWCDCRPPLDKRECEICKKLDATKEEKLEDIKEVAGNQNEDK